MKTRIIAGLIAAVALVALVLFGSPLWVIFVILGLAPISYLEFDRLFFPDASLSRQVRMVVLIAVALCALRANQAWGWISIWFTFVALSVVEVFRSSRTGDFQGSIRELSLEFLGFVYIVGLFGFLVPIMELPNGREWLLLLFILVFMGDTFAYFIGTLLGKHTLAARLSPKKSVEGAIGGLIFSCLGAYAWIHYTLQGDMDGRGYKLLFFVPFASVLAQVGDLFESMFKRSQLKKDSGTFLPGHGGILDRLDGLALVSPVYYVYLTMVVK